jgi:hypothetical protein
MFRVAEITFLASSSCRDGLGCVAYSSSVLILKFESYRQSVELLGRGISPSQGSYLYTGQHKHRITQTDIHAVSGIRTHDSSV